MKNEVKNAELLLSNILADSPFRNHAFSVGGFVRDEILGIESKDLDVVIDFHGGAESVVNFINNHFPKSTNSPLQIGAGYPIWSLTFKDDVVYNDVTYNVNGAVVEFADAQKEAFPDENSRQRITVPGTLLDDVERRDFTVNSLMRNLTTGEIIDLSGVGLKDLKEGILRGNPNVDFDKVLRDDPLRMIRLVRFHAKYGWKVPMETLRAIKRNAARIEIVSAERIRAEFEKIMEIGKTAKAIRFMKAVGLLKYVLPEFEDLFGVFHDTSRNFHLEANGHVWGHCLLVLQNAKQGIENQLAALFHDIGKPATRKLNGEKIQFLNHESVGAVMAETIMRRMKFDNDTIKRVRRLVQHHMRPGLVSDSDTSSKAVRKFIRDVGDDLVDQLLDLAEADTTSNYPVDNYVPALRERIKTSLIVVPVSNKPVLNGNEIMTLLGITGSPIIGEIVKFLLEQQDNCASEGNVLSKEDAEKLVLDKFKEFKK